MWHDIVDDVVTDDDVYMCLAPLSEFYVKTHPGTSNYKYNIAK